MYLTPALPPALIHLHFLSYAHPLFGHLASVIPLLNVEEAEVSPGHLLLLEEGHQLLPLLLRHPLITLPVPQHSTDHQNQAKHSVSLGVC